MSLLSLSGKVAVVTGAAGGIGAAMARLLSESGANVVVVDINGDAAIELARTLPTASIGVKADVSNEDDVKGYMQQAVNHFGRVDLYHLNAGIVGSFASLPDLSTEDFDKVIAINLRGPFLGLREAFRQYMKQESGGAIVLTASIASLRGSHDLLPYQTSKHGVMGLLHGAAMYGGPMNIRVNAVAPGLIPTELFASNKSSTGGGNDMVQRGTTVPMRRVGTPDEIARVAAFLLSDQASYINGEVISVDGGSSIVNTVRPAGGAGAWDTSTVDKRP
ncbi:SDR family NAD(P)-dependent oxidoreductase [Pseudomonas sp. PLMAX]|uniref:SDR family NAD(P)-dependent oxidoreductase n=1 Tax=Pseudomonas sp. PLMAX TaxID=2201998 RepID=UPI0038B9F1F1